MLHRGLRCSLSVPLVFHACSADVPVISGTWNWLIYHNLRPQNWRVPQIFTKQFSKISSSVRRTGYCLTDGTSSQQKLVDRRWRIQGLDSLDLERDVHGPGGVSDAADGDQVDAGFGKRTNAFEVHSARSFDKYGRIQVA